MMTAEERARVLREAKPNSWIEFSSDESKVVGHDATYSEAVQDAEKHGEEDPLLIKIPDTCEPRVFSHCV